MPWKIEYKRESEISYAMIIPKSKRKYDAFGGYKNIERRLYVFENYNKTWSVMALKKNTGIKGWSKNFKTKPKALAYAKKWMKTHPNG